MIKEEAIRTVMVIQELVEGDR